MVLAQNNVSLNLQSIQRKDLAPKGKLPWFSRVIPMCSKDIFFFVGVEKYIGC